MRQKRVPRNINKIQACVDLQINNIPTKYKMVRHSWHQHKYLYVFFPAQHCTTELFSYLHILKFHGTLFTYSPFGVPGAFV